MSLQLKSAPKQKPSNGSSSITAFLSQDIQLFPYKLKDKKKESFYLELSSLLSSSVDIRTCLSLIIEQQSKQKDKALIMQINEDVIGGKSLSDAMEDTKKFTPYEIHSVKIGEESGLLAEVAKELAAYFQKKIKQRMQLVSALTYPIIVIGFAVFAVFFLMHFIVPMFADVFKRFGGDLPWVTKQVVATSNFLGEYAGMIFMTILGIGIIISISKKKLWFQKISSTIALKLPFFGSIIRQTHLSRFSQSMSLLIKANIPMLRAISLVKEMIGFYPLTHSLTISEKDIMDGVSLYQSLGKFGIYDKKMLALIRIGEEVNKLDEFFDRLATQYADEVEHKTKTLSNLLEPFMILFLGFLVSIILVSMYLPLFNLSNQFL